MNDQVSSKLALDVAFKDGALTEYLRVDVSHRIRPFQVVVTKNEKMRQEYVVTHQSLKPDFPVNATSETVLEAVNTKMVVRFTAGVQSSVYIRFCIIRQEDYECKDTQN